jgi:hypothetical protein
LAVHATKRCYKFLYVFLPVNLAPWKLTLGEEGLALLVHAEQKNRGKKDLQMKKDKNG